MKIIAILNLIIYNSLDNLLAYGGEKPSSLFQNQKQASLYRSLPLFMPEIPAVLQKEASLALFNITGSPFLSQIHPTKIKNAPLFPTA